MRSSLWKPKGLQNRMQEFMHYIRFTQRRTTSVTTGDPVASNHSMVSRIASSNRGARLGSSLSPFATRSIRSTGLGLLPIGSVVLVIEEGLSILTALLELFDDLTYSGRNFSLYAVSWNDSCSLREKIRPAVVQSAAFLGGHPLKRLAFLLLV